jgi:transcriptional regulator with XRE-family HTH domain
MNNVSASNKDTRTALASNLRRLRIARHLSLSQLAQSTSLSKATLSGIENGHGNPTIETLTVLAEALRIPVAELLQDTPAQEVRVVRVSEAPPGPPDGLGQRPLERIGSLDGSLEIVELALPPHHLHEPKPRTDESRDGVLVLQGKLIAGPAERITELATGDYASFPADIPHLYESGRSPTRALILRYTPA